MIRWARYNLPAGNPTPEQQKILTEPDAEADAQITGWSCNDGIRNGDEIMIDCLENSALWGDWLAYN